MATLVLRFPGGRYHATATGHHVNEGVVEWPPSPWRMLRALIACGYATHHWSALPSTARSLVESLAGVLPEYRLPQSSLGHSRHYMPLGTLDKGREKTALVYDTFAHVGEEAMWVRWPVSLGVEEQALFASLAENLGYLGRSESWVLARAVSDDEALPTAGRAFPHEDGSRPDRGYEQLALHASDSVVDYAGWRAKEVEAALRQALGGTTEKKPTKAQQKKRAAIEQGYP
ncbi:MAG: type I-U CRISPR-associated protein Cas5/Cas6, partial [Deltaproteobacteria bacterium]|nr:type I-U CRISPR-associated protein Cas5/Cas6 [Deltaproteobacteria bacterium]